MSEVAAEATTAAEPVITQSPAGATTILGAQPAAEDWRSTIPEKFRATTETGFDLNGEALLKSYSHLEQRVGKFGLPPDAVDKYTQPEGVDNWSAETWNPLKTSALELGLSDKQLSGFLPHIVDSAKELAQSIAKDADFADLRDELGIMSAPDPVAAKVALISEFGDENGFNKASTLAQKAAMAYGVDVTDPFLGNNVSLFKALAKIGQEMGTDTSVTNATLSSVDLSSLRAPNSPYWDVSHPEHAVYQQKVKDHYAAVNRRK